MKSKNLLVIIIVLLLIVAIAAVGVFFFFHSKKNTAKNIFECAAYDELEQYVEDNDIVYEKRDNALHLFNVSFIDLNGYCVAEFDSATGDVQSMSFYLTFENDAELSQNIEKVKEDFLKEFDFEGEYEYFPLNGYSDDVGENDFLKKNASKELFVYDENTTWNISWYITDEGVSAKISKSVFE